MLRKSRTFLGTFPRTEPFETTDISFVVTLRELEGMLTDPGLCLFKVHNVPGWKDTRAARVESRQR